MKWWLKKLFLRIKLYAAENYQNEAESLVIWYAVCYSLGAALYLSLPIEISATASIILFEVLLLALYLTRKNDKFFKPLTYVTIFILGFNIAKADAMYKQSKLEEKSPEISYLHGYIEDLDYNSTGKTRITINYVDDFEHDLNGKFRISTRQKLPWLKKGICIELVAQFPKNYSTDPLDNYNYNRSLFYQGINAGGYAISPIFTSVCEKEPSWLKQKIEKWRTFIAEKINSTTKAEQVGIIEALTIGEKRHIPPEITQNYRISGLAHVLAISGMHMGIITLLVFLLIRLLLVPFGAGRYDTRKPAAICAMIVSLGYFLISGQSISCLRAFIMTMIILLAVCLNRRAISIRSWAFALFVVVSIIPSAVISPGFLMSFSAVLGLVSFYEAKSQTIGLWYRNQTVYGKLGIYFLGVIMTDAVASLMTLPFSLYYFHQISVYTTVGNFLAAPVITFCLMPAILLFLISLPLGLADYALHPLASSVELLNKITAYVSSIAGAHVGENLLQMPDSSIFMITIGLLWLCIWQQRWRYWGFAIIIAGFIVFYLTPKADFVFDEGGKTFACRTNNGKLAPTPWIRNKFLSKMWTGEDKFAKSQITEGLTCTKQQCICQKEIEFSKGKVSFQGKQISLKNSGFINLKKGIYYTKRNQHRIWNKM